MCTRTHESRRHGHAVRARRWQESVIVARGQVTSHENASGPKSLMWGGRAREGEEPVEETMPLGRCLQSVFPHGAMAMMMNIWEWRTRPYGGCPTAGVMLALQKTATRGRSGASVADHE